MRTRSIGGDGRKGAAGGGERCQMRPTETEASPARLLTVAEVAEWLCCSAGWVRAHASGARRPKLPSVKMGGAVRFRREAIEKFISDCERSASDLEKRRR